MAPSGARSTALVADAVGVSEVHITGSGVPSARQGLGWLRDLPHLRALTLTGRRLPPVPDEVLARVEVLDWDGPSSQTIATSQIPKVRSLSAGRSNAVVGSFSECPSLRQLYLGKFTGDLDSLAGCDVLESAKLLGRHQVLRSSWSVPPAGLLEHLQLYDVDLETLAVIGQLKHLKTLIINVARPRQPESPLDLACLADCSQIEWLQLPRTAHSSGVDAVSGLPRLERLVVRKDNYSPSDVGQLPITVVPKYVPPRR